MKKILALLIAYLIVYFMTSGTLYPYADVSVKVSYINGSVSINPGQKGTLSIKDDSIVFSWGNEEIEIPYNSVSQLSWSEKKRRLKSASLDMPFSSYQPYIYIPPPMPKIEYEPNPLSYVLWGLAIVFLIIGMVKMTEPNKVYFRIDFEREGQPDWMLFKVTEDRFNVLYLNITKRSGKDIVLVGK